MKRSDLFCDCEACRLSADIFLEDDPMQLKAHDRYSGYYFFERMPKRLMIVFLQETRLTTKKIFNKKFRKFRHFILYSVNLNHFWRGIATREKAYDQMPLTKEEVEYINNRANIVYKIGYHK